ncbi:DUF3108 domain-containing protein [Taklimakanibacter lacteus]|uniref:DUF3108 domain-containing protein n=1 Tax=Taklimakanibacter lacteus TaxID=2268456 RepID=UPI000E66BD6C
MEIAAGTLISKAFRFKIAAGCAPALAAILLAYAFEGSAVAAQKGRVKAGYVVEVGGISVLKMSYDAALTERAYQSKATVKTKGLAGLFSDYRMDMTATGAVVGNDPRPSWFRSRAEKKDKNKTIELSWRDGEPPSIDPSPDADDKRLFGDAVIASLVDPLSMIVRLTALQEDRPCQTVERVFDGKEVYDLKFELAGKVTIGSEEGGNYRGPALKCSVTYTPVAGRPAVRFKKKGLTPPKFDIWFAPARSGTEGTLFLPVLATGKLKGFSFVAYANKTMIDGVPLASSAD